MSFAHRRFSARLVNGSTDGKVLWKDPSECEGNRVKKKVTFCIVMCFVFLFARCPFLRAQQIHLLCCYKQKTDTVDVCTRLGAENPRGGRRHHQSTTCRARSTLDTSVSGLTSGKGVLGNMFYGYTSLNSWRTRLTFPFLWNSLNFYPLFICLLQETYPHTPPVWFAESEETNITNAIQLLSNTSGLDNHVINQVSVNKAFIRPASTHSVTILEPGQCIASPYVD